MYGIGCPISYSNAMIRLINCYYYGKGIAMRKCQSGQEIEAWLFFGITFGFPLDGLFPVAIPFVFKQINVAENDLLHTSHSCHSVMALGFITRTAAFLKPHSLTLPSSMVCSDLASSSLTFPKIAMRIMRPG
jgi:hypothetical protein